MKWLNLDLPNLTSIINSDGGSFSSPCSVTLESILKYWKLIWSRYSESSKCQTTWFIQESSIEINIEYCLIDLISFIDISTQIRNIVPLFCLEIHSFDAANTSIFIPNWSCNDNNYTIFDFSRFTLVESIEIGDDCFESVQTFKIDGLNQLKSLKIGKNSFTQLKESNWNWYKADDKSKSFHILNCESLESIEIGEYSFSDFGGQFELKNLPSLQSIQIGTIGSDSYNFYCSSFVIRGILNDIEYVMIRSS